MGPSGTVGDGSFDWLLDLPFLSRPGQVPEYSCAGKNNWRERLSGCCEMVNSNV